MNDLPDNELLSAYLDGELTAAEQAQVEELLTASPAARQLLEELRALSGTVQSLPQHKLDEDLSDRVLRMAERRVLTESDQPRRAAPVPTPAPHRSIIRRVLSPRALVWSGLAVAAAMLIMVTDQHLRDQRQGREVATTAGDSKAERGAEEAFRSKDSPEDLAENEAADSAPRRRLGKQKKAAVDGDTPKGAVAKRSLPLAGATEKGRPPALPASPVVAGEGGQRVAKDDAEPDSRAVGRAEAGQFADKRLDVAGEAVVGGDGLRYGGTVAGGLVLVDISPEAARQRTFKKLLLAQGIDWQKTEVQVEDLAEEQAATNLPPREPARREVRDMAERERSYRAGAGAHDIHLVCVEAAPAQVEATLAELARRVEKSGGIVSVSVSPARGVEVQQGWTAYNRSAEQLRRAGQTQAEQLQTLEEEEPKLAEAVAQSVQDVVKQEGLQRGRAWPVEDWGRWSYDQARPPTAHYHAIPSDGAAMGQPAPGAPREPISEPLHSQMSRPAPTAAQSVELPPEQQAETSPADQPAAEQQMDAAPAPTLRLAEQVLDTLDVEEGRGLQRAPTQRVLFVLRVVEPDLPTATPAAEAAPAKQ